MWKEVKAVKLTAETFLLPTPSKRQEGLVARGQPGGGGSDTCDVSPPVDDDRVAEAAIPAGLRGHLDKTQVHAVRGQRMGRPA
eukprot:scaffold290323_cov41-Prasinocladus_malaysianus.AAC.1